MNGVTVFANTAVTSTSSSRANMEITHLVVSSDTGAELKTNGSRC